MSDLLAAIKEDIKDAMRARDTERLSTLRMVHSSIKNRSIDQSEELSDDDVIAVLAKEAKKRRQSAQAYEDGNRPELAQKERNELEVIKGYLPEPLSDDDVAKIVDEIIADTGATSRREMGKVMGAVIPRIKGRYDASKVKDIVLEKLG